MMAHPARSEEKGFTLPEVIITVMLLGIVSIVLFGSLYSMTAATKGAQERAGALVQARQAVEVISRDLRAATPIYEQNPVSTYNNKVSFNVYCSTASIGPCGSTNLRKVTYELVPAEFALYRQVGSATPIKILGPSGPDALPLGRQRGAIVNPSNVPLFTYFDLQGVAFRTGAGAPPAEDFRRCTKTVQIRVAVVSDLDNFDRSVDISTKVHLRNRNRVRCTPS